MGQPGFLKVVEPVKDYKHRSKIKEDQQWVKEWLIRKQLNNPIFLVDTSVLIRLCSYGQENVAARLFLADNPVDQSLIIQVAVKLVEYTYQFVPEGSEVIFVFEAGKSTTKNTVDGRKRIRSHAISQALRVLKLSNSWGHVQRGMRMLNRVAGFELQQLAAIAQELQSRNFNVHFTQAEADTYIVQLSEQLVQSVYDPVVISVDSDLLVFGDSIKALLYPTFAYRSLILRSDVLQLLQLSHKQLRFLYLLIGCDNTRGIQGLGWKKGASLIHQKPIESMPVEELYQNLRKILPKISRKVVSTAYEDIQHVEAELLFALQDFQGVSPQPQSRLRRHLLERDSTGKLRREKMMQLILYGSVIPDREKPKSSDYKVAQRKVRELQARNKADHAIQYDFNMYGCLSVQEVSDEESVQPPNDADKPSIDTALLSIAGAPKRTKKSNKKKDDKSTGPPDQKPLRKMSASKKEDYRQKALHLLQTYTVGTVPKLINGELLELGFDEYLLEYMCLLQTIDNNSKIHVNDYLRKCADNSVDFTLNDLKQQFELGCREVSKGHSRIPPQLFRTAIGNIKSSISNRLYTCVVEHVKRQLISAEVALRDYQYYVDALSQSIASFIVGTSKDVIADRQCSSAVEGDVDESEVNRDEVETRSLAQLLAHNLLYSKKTIPQSCFLVCQRYCQMPADELKRLFFHVSLQGLDMSEPLLSQVTDTNVPSFVKFFGFLNVTEWTQSMFPQATVKHKFHLLSSTTLSDVFCGFLKDSQRMAKVGKIAERWLAANVAYAPTKCCFFKHGHLYRSVSYYSSEPDFLWRFVFPGISWFVTKLPHLHFWHSMQTDGSILKGLFANQKLSTSRKEGSRAVDVHKAQRVGFGYGNWRRFETKPLTSLSKIVGDRVKSNRKSGMRTCSAGFKGLLYFEQVAECFAHGVEELESVFNHPLVFIDLGLISFIAMTVVDANLIQEHGVILVKSRIVTKLFRGCSFYSNSGTDDLITNKLDMMEKEAISKLSEQSSKTMSVVEFQQYIANFKSVEEQLLKQNYSAPAVNLKVQQEIKKQNYWNRVNNTILSLCDAVCPRKKGNPIIVAGNPTFKATMKGHRSGCPKKTLKFLGRFFCVVVINEYNSSKLCPKCELYMEQVPGVKGTRMWQCQLDCKHSDGKTRLIVNKDISACQSFEKIFCSLVAYGVRPITYMNRHKISNISSDIQYVAFTNFSDVLTLEK